MGLIEANEVWTYPQAIFDKTLWLC